VIRTLVKLWAQGSADLIPLVVSAQVDRVKDYFARFIHAQHNAQVIINFENRMSSVIYQATGGMMSKSYYTIEAMKAEIDAHQQRELEFWYAEGRKDLCEELGIRDPNDEDE
jgi:hypothetical protein